ncbi:MAG TPA: CCA tRNA nucleotidyltransferase, partial [Geobacteraceae bacterium]|nr:CCA tRNA nucleotidyltransferase [Geobacteraceae bacterium]
MEEAGLKKIMEHDDLRIIAGMAAELGVDAYLVGGYLRDCLLGRESKDLDFALSGAWEELPRNFAARIRGRFFWLDEKRLQGRVVKKSGDEISFSDFAPMRGGTVMDDLRLRDFTINALALPLDGERRELIDPLAGRDDLLHGMIRACSTAAFDDDPLRLM